MPIAKLLSQELQYESGLSRKLMERIPEDKLGWKPHEKSMPIGRLGLHIAELPSWIETILTSEELDIGTIEFKPRFPETTTEILETLLKNLDSALTILSETSDAHLDGTWKLLFNGNVISEQTRRKFIQREIKHTIHHRGQLTVFLRLLDIPVPQTFGPTADER